MSASNINLGSQRCIARQGIDNFPKLIGISHSVKTVGIADCLKQLFIVVSLLAFLDMNGMNWSPPISSYSKNLIQPFVIIRMWAL